MTHVPTEKDVQSILDQAPSWATAIQIHELWAEYAGDVVAIVSKLWDVPPKAAKEKTKWDYMREICDGYDNAMYNQIHSIQAEEANGK